MKKVRISENSANFALESNQLSRRQHFDSLNIEETLHPVNKDYGMMAVPGTKTPFPKKEQTIDTSLLRGRLITLAQEDSPKFHENHSGMGSLQPLFSALSFSDGSLIVGECLKEKRARIEKREYTLTKCGMDMRNVIHKPADSIPNVTKAFPQVSWPKEDLDDQRYAVHN